jgi:hypothetical protein
VGEVLSIASGDGDGQKSGLGSLGAKQVHDGGADAGVIHGEVDGAGEGGRMGDFHYAAHNIRIWRPDGDALEVAELELDLLSEGPDSVVELALEDGALENGDGREVVRLA